MTGEFPAQRASYAEMFPFDDVVMIEKYIITLINHERVSCWVADIQRNIYLSLHVVEVKPRTTLNSEIPSVA